MNGCPRLETLMALTECTLPEEEAAEVEVHLKECRACREKVWNLERNAVPLFRRINARNSSAENSSAETETASDPEKE